MNIFNIGGMELLLIITIALIVAGPKRIAVWAYQMGVWAAKLQDLWSEFAKVLQQEMDEAGINVQIPNKPPTRDQLTRSVQEFGREISKAAEESVSDVKKEVENLQAELQQERDTIKRPVDDLAKDIKRQHTEIQQERGKLLRPPGYETPETQTPSDPPTSPEQTEQEPTSSDTDSVDFGSWGGK